MLQAASAARRPQAERRRAAHASAAPHACQPAAARRAPRRGCAAHPQAAADAAEDLEEVLALRADVINQSGPLAMQADHLAKYFRMLT